MNPLQAKLRAELSAHTWHLWDEYQSALQARLQMDGAAQPASRDEYGPTYDIVGDPLPRPEMVDGVWIVPVNGVLMNKASDLAKRFGFVDHADIGRMITAGINQDADAILLDIDCPGGTVAGTPELSRAIAAIAASPESPWMASFSSGITASAAEYISAGVQSAFTTPSSTRGSIGTILEVVSVEDALDKMGIRVDLITSGEFKGAGHPAKTLTEAQRENLQERVDALAGEFKDTMIAHRGLTEADMQGQVFTGTQAAEIGLVDGLVCGLGEVLELIGR